MGASHVLVGAQMADATAAGGPFDLRYLYLAGGIPAGGPCASCASGCSGSAAWWGCWQSSQVPPGQYALDFLSKAQGDGQIPMFTYDTLLQASGASEGNGEVAAANDPAFMARYLADWRFLLQKVGSRVAFLHVEPDFWGYAERVNPDPTQIPAAVASANPTDCAGQPDTIAGLGRCMIAMARTYAPNAKVGLHASAWGTGVDALLNGSASTDIAAEARKLGQFMAAAGAGQGDFVVIDASDRDAGWYQTQGRSTWWDATNATLPNFSQALTWARALAEAVGRPLLWWQVPVGNLGLNDVANRYRDNRVDYFFDHPADLAAAHVAGMAFGAGATGQTTPETDDGHLVSRAQAYRAAGGQPACP